MQLFDELNRRIEAAGLADHPEDYLWRPVIDGALTFRDLKEGTADLADIVQANDALDRRHARQRGEAQRALPAKVAALVRTLELLNKNPAAAISEVARTIADEIGLTSKYIERLIRPTFKEWKSKHAKPL